MEKAVKIVLIAIILTLIFDIVFFSKDFIRDYFTFNPIIKSTMTGVVVKVNKDELMVLGTGDYNSLYRVSLTKTGDIGFKQGQDILIYYNGFIAQMYPGIPEGVTKIEIIKDKSDTEIPENILKYCYNFDIKKENVDMIKIKANNSVLDVKLEENEATKSLIKLLEKEDITVEAHEYGGFEKIGNLGFSLPKNDTNITTQPGDIVLYQGNQISLFYNSNSWNYTKLGKVQNITADELSNVLGTGDVTLVLSID